MTDTGGTDGNQKKGRGPAIDKPRPTEGAFLRLRRGKRGPEKRASFRGGKKRRNVYLKNDGNLPGETNLFEERQGHANKLSKSRKIP